MALVAAAVAHHFLLAGKPPPRVVWYRNGRIFSTAAKVVYTCSNLLQLAPGSRDLSQAEKRITVM